MILAEVENGGVHQVKGSLVRIALVTLSLLLSAMLLGYSGVAPIGAAGNSVDQESDILLPLLTAVQPAEVSGNVYRDYNADGDRDSGEPGEPNITVSAYDAAGAWVAATVTDAEGNYTLLLADGIAYRLEFTGMADYLQPGAVGANTGPSVAFVQAPVSGVNTGVNNPADYCQSNPELAVSCFIFGDQQVNEPALVSFRYEAGSTALDDAFEPQGGSPYDDADSNQPGIQVHPVEATTQEVGTTYGLAYHRSANAVFAGAFMKRHSGFGPSGTGAIYRLDRNTGTVSLYADLNSIFGSNVAGDNPHDSSGISNEAEQDRFYFNDPSFDEVGKIALGDLEITADEQYLYAVNLADKRLYRLPVLNEASPSLTTFDVTSVSTPQPSSCAPADTRPFALAVKDDTLYLGITCTAQSSGDRDDLRAYVYAYDGTAFGAQPVLEFALNYPRTCANNPMPGEAEICAITTGDNADADWQPWVSTFGELLTENGVAALRAELCPDPDGVCRRNVIYPQPLLSDIQFDQGNMVLGLRDRNGDLIGNVTGDPRDANGNPVGFSESISQMGDQYLTVTAGDILRAAPDDSGQWQLEDNGQVGAQPATGGADNNDGPGGGEFYFAEAFAPHVDNLSRHNEIAQGGLSAVAGQPSVLTTAFNPVPIEDPVNWFDGGVLWLDNGSGERNRTYRVFASDPPPTDTPLGPGKNNGLGDLEVLCDPAPIEIGDRAWIDENKNGIQDPGEPPLPGVSVRLYAPDGATLLATAVTNAQGYYYFSSAETGPISGAHAVYGVDGLQPDTTGYQIMVDMKQPAVADKDLSLTIPDADGHTDNDSKSDLRDSDAILVDMGSQGLITFDTGPAGYNNHTLDIGFILSATPGISIEKHTNGQDADLVDGPDVPQLLIGAPVTWTYDVTNTGTVTFAGADVVVTDDQGVTPLFDSVLVGDADDQLEPGETWQYKATGVALNVGSMSDVPRLWGVDEQQNELFSIEDYRLIGSGSAAAGLTIYGSLYYPYGPAATPTLIGKHIGSFAIDGGDHTAYMAYNMDLSTGPATELAAPVLLSIDLSQANTTVTNTVVVIGSIPIAGFDPGLADDNISGFDVHPATGDLYALYRVTDGPALDKLLIISKSDASVVADLGEMSSASLGVAVEDGEEIEFDSSGNLYVTDNWDDHLYQVDPATAEIIAVIDNDERGGLVAATALNFKTEGLAWDPINSTLVAAEDHNDLFYIQTLENGNNAGLGTLPELLDVESMDLILQCYANIGTVEVTVTVGGVSQTVTASDPSHYCNVG